MNRARGMVSNTTVRHPLPALRLILVVALTLTSCILAQENWETGTVADAHFRMKLPAQWNRSLVLAAGGYAPEPITFQPDQSAGRFAEELVRQGYAYAETGYSVGGVAIGEGVADVRALRRHFITRYGSPERTFVVGESKGGLIAVVLAESAAREVDGALVIGGLLSAPYAFFSRAFDLLGRFHEEFPDVLPPPTAIPKTYAADEETVTRVLTSLERSEATARRVRTHARVRSNQDLAELVAFHTEALGDLQRRCGGNPFTGGGALANRDAERCVRSMPVPTGKLQRPVLALETAYDPVIPSSFADEYIALLNTNGRLNSFVREVVPGEGHLNVRTAERLNAFAALARWCAEGVRPRPD
jgi:pimeloyl-ACP methyl ester carboxylesterase